MSHHRNLQNNELSYANARRIARQICNLAIRMNISPIGILNSRTFNAPLRALVIECMEIRLRRKYKEELYKLRQHKILRNIERDFNQYRLMRNNRLTSNRAINHENSYPSSAPAMPPSAALENQTTLSRSSPRNISRSTQRISLKSPQSELANDVVVSDLDFLLSVMEDD
eukprot:NODE_579_length_5813_cov_0.453448.p4 type:complete len:170 gc:universal NODE_579_length_5813_cov_0.453448:1912-1403(-)